MTDELKSIDDIIIQLQEISEELYITTRHDGEIVDAVDDVIYELRKHTR